MWPNNIKPIDEPNANSFLAHYSNQLSANENKIPIPSQIGNGIGSLLPDPQLQFNSVDKPKRKYKRRRKAIKKQRKKMKATTKRRKGKSNRLYKGRKNTSKKTKRRVKRRPNKKIIAERNLKNSNF